MFARLSVRRPTQSRSASEYARLLDSLPRAKRAGHDAASLNTRNPCFEGTRKAILEYINSWVENPDPDTPPIFWLNGLAGIGKSTIAQSTANSAHQRGLLGASFFFSRADDDLSNPLMVLPTLAFQLAQFDQTFKGHIGAVLEQKSNLGYLSLSQQLEELIIGPLLPLVGTEERVVIIILDALDECKRPGAEELLQLLFSHIRRLPFIRILITSRPDPHIRSVFSKEQNHAKAVLHDVEASVIEHDIFVYLQAELAKIPKRLGKSALSSWPSDDELRALVKKAGKLFVYAATSVRLIGDDIVDDPENQLRVVLGLEKVPEPVTTFFELDGLYLQILHATLPKQNPTIVQNRFQAVVGSIVLLRDPLPLDALARFVNYDSVGPVRTVLSQLHSVIIPPLENTDVPRIYHPSFPDFLIGQSRCSDPRFTIVVPEHERRHTLRCFELMSKCLRRDIASIRDPSLLNSEVEEFEQRIQRAIPPELRYACLYWASHLLCVEHGDRDVIGALNDFLMRSLLWWFEAMSLIGGIFNIAGTIKEVQRWVVCALTAFDE